MRGKRRSKLADATAKKKAKAAADAALAADAATAPANATAAADVLGLSRPLRLLLPLLHLLPRRIPVRTFTFLCLYDSTYTISYNLSFYVASDKML